MEPGLPVSTSSRFRMTWSTSTREPLRTIIIDLTTSSTSPVVLIPGPGPDKKPVTQPPEGTWIIINPRVAGLQWVKKLKEIISCHDRTGKTSLKSRTEHWQEKINWRKLDYVGQVWMLKNNEVSVKNSKWPTSELLVKPFKICVYLCTVWKEREEVKRSEWNGKWRTGGTGKGWKCQGEKEIDDTVMESDYAIGI